GRRGPRAEAGQGAGRGPAEGALEARHLDRRLLPRLAVLRGRRAGPQVHRQLVPRHPLAARREPGRGAGKPSRGRPRPRPAGEGGGVRGGGLYAGGREGEKHGWNPETVALLQNAARAENGDGPELYEAFRDRVDGEQQGLTLRGLMRPRADREPIPIEQVEPA